MNKVKIAVAVCAINIFGTACGGNDTGQSRSNYVLQSSSCPGVFDEKVEVVEEENYLAVLPTSPNKSGFSGQKDADGNFNINSANGQCTGRIVAGLATANCTIEGERCTVQYSKQ